MPRKLEICDPAAATTAIGGNAVAGWCMAILLAALSPRSGSCHGLNCSVTPGVAGIVTAATIPGDPIAFARVQIYGPQSDSVEFANGRTDMAGHFAFVPDRPGKWKIRLVAESDHGPHIFTTDFQVNQVLEVQPFIHGGDWLERAAAGGGLLVAVGGWWAYWLERRKRLDHQFIHLPAGRGPAA